MTEPQLEVKRGARLVMATVHHTAGNYAVVDDGGQRLMVKRSQGAWREMTIDEAIVRLNVLERARNGN